MKYAPSARAMGLASCGVCALLMRLPPGRRSGICPRCNTPVTMRKPQSEARTWAYLAAALVLYFPSNLLPVMHAHNPVSVRDDTIMSGITYLWQGRAWPLAIIVFIASIVIPLAKLLILSVLLYSIRARSVARLVWRTRLYRVVEVIGQWSMLDVYVIALLTSLVQMGNIAEVTPGPGALAFAAVVILTILAARAFDPRLMWDQLSVAIEARGPAPILLAPALGVDASGHRE